MHIRAVKEPWHHSNRVSPLEQMKVFNSRLSKLEYFSNKLNQIYTSSLESTGKNRGDGDDNDNDNDNDNDDDNTIYQNELLEIYDIKVDSNVSNGDGAIDEEKASHEVYLAKKPGLCILTNRTTWD